MMMEYQQNTDFDEDLMMKYLGTLLSVEREEQDKLQNLLREYFLSHALYYKQKKVAATVQQRFY